MSMPTLNYPDVVGAKQRLVAIEKEITTAVITILNRPASGDAKPFMRYEAQGVYPKWLNKLSTEKPEDFGIWEEYIPVVIETELQVGKRTEGFDGVLEQSLDVWIPYTIALARTRPRLTSDAYGTPPAHMLEASCRLGDPLMPGDVIAAKFIWSLAFFVENAERDY